MPRSYSEKFIREITADENIGGNLGRELAKLCIHSNIPMPCIAKALGVTRLTVFNWFRGKAINERRHLAVHSLMASIKWGLSRGELPAKNLAHARQFVESMTHHTT